MAANRKPLGRYVRRGGSSPELIPAGPLFFATSTLNIWRDQVFADKELKSISLLVASLLANRSDASGKSVWGSQVGMAKELGLSDRHVRRGIEGLERRGHLVVWRGRLCRKTDENGKSTIIGRTHSNMYHLVLDGARKELKRWRGYFKKMMASWSEVEEPLPPSDGRVEDLILAESISITPSNGPPPVDPTTEPVVELSAQDRALMLSRLQETASRL